MAGGAAGDYVQSPGAIGQLLRGGEVGVSPGVGSGSIYPLTVLGNYRRAARTVNDGIGDDPKVVTRKRVKQVMEVGLTGHRGHHHFLAGVALVKLILRSVGVDDGIEPAGGLIGGRAY